MGGWLRLRGFGAGAGLLLLGAAGAPPAVAAALEAARSLLRPWGAAWLGARPGRRWLADRFRHLSHPYRDGASLYFTVFFRCPADPDAAVARWAGLKRRATEAVVGAGGTLSHHHGIGAWHAPWYPREAGELGIQAIRRLAGELDPDGVLNPHVLLDPADRLEE